MVCASGVCSFRFAGWVTIRAFSKPSVTLIATVKMDCFPGQDCEDSEEAIGKSGKSKMKCKSNAPVLRALLFSVSPQDRQFAG